MKRLLVVAFVGVGCALFACEDVEKYVFTARPYDASAKCVGVYAPVEVIDGTGADAICPLYCLRGDNGLFVTAVCAPIPEDYSLVDASDPECTSALVAPACGGDTPDGVVDAGDGVVDAGDGVVDAGDGDAKADH